MFQKLSSFVLAGLGLAAALSASSAQAHIELQDPVARYPLIMPETGIKSCPCGMGGSNRSCNVAVDGSDPDRSTDRVSRFEAGSTITLTFTEFVDHAGRFRVAFDPEGADMADFNANILEDIPDPAGTGGRVWEMDVTLPNTTCTNCTLQLVQAMNNDTVNRVLDPATTSSYYVCVDLELVAPGTLGEGDDTDPAPGDPADMDPMTDVDGSSMDPESTMNVGAPQDRPLPTTPGMDSVTDPTVTENEVGAGDMVAMNGTPGSTAPVFNANGAPSSGSSSSSTGGCSVGAAGPHAAGSFALLALIAAIGLRWRPRRGRALSVQAL